MRIEDMPRDLRRGYRLAQTVRNLLAIVLFFVVWELLDAKDEASRWQYLAETAYHTCEGVSDE